MDLKHEDVPRFAGDSIVSVNRCTPQQVAAFHAVQDQSNWRCRVIPHVVLRRGKDGKDSTRDMLVETGRYTALWIAPDGSSEEAQVPDSGYCMGNPTVAACIAQGGGCRRSIACNE